jgi:hypothetical protein
MYQQSFRCVFRRGAAVLAIIILLFSLPACKTAPKLEPEAATKKQNLLIDMMEAYLAKKERPAKERVNKSLGLVKRVPGDASAEEMEQALKEIVLEMRRATRKDLSDIHEAVMLLRKKSEVIRGLKRLYSGVPQNKYYDRLFIIRLTGELQRTDALDFLKDVAWKELPAASPKAAERLTPREYEEIIQSKAVHGLAFMRDNNGELHTEGIKETLKIAKTHPSHAVRIAAIDAFMWNQGDRKEAAAKLYADIPAEYHKYVEMPRFYRGMNRGLFDKRLKAWRKKWAR